MKIYLGNKRGYLIGTPTVINYLKPPESKITKLKVKKIIKLQRFIKLYIRLPTLWKIAEYYTKKKYSPENILKYINLE